MPIGAKRIIKELGTAVAVLAMYALLLLAPWHQSAELQHDLAELGYASTATFDICASPVEDDGEDQPAALKCHIAGIGKFDLVLVEPSPVALVSPHAAAPVFYAADGIVEGTARPPHTGQARAPPVMA